MQTEYTILSPQGEITTDHNGDIITDNRENSDSLIKIDIQAYLHWCRSKEITPAEQIDILLVGYWDKSGQYSGPEKEALIELAREKNTAYALTRDIYGQYADEVFLNPTKEQVLKIYNAKAECISIEVTENFTWQKGDEVIKKNLNWFEEAQWN